MSLYWQNVLHRSLSLSKEQLKSHFKFSLLLRHFSWPLRPPCQLLKKQKPSTKARRHIWLTPSLRTVFCLHLLGGWPFNFERWGPPLQLSAGESWCLAQIINQTYPWRATQPAPFISSEQRKKAMKTRKEGSNLTCWLGREGAWGIGVEGKIWKDWDW